MGQVRALRPQSQQHCLFRVSSPALGSADPEGPALPTWSRACHPGCGEGRRGSLSRRSRRSSQAGPGVAEAGALPGDL